MDNYSYSTISGYISLPTKPNNLTVYRNNICIYIYIYIYIYILIYEYNIHYSQVKL